MITYSFILPFWTAHLKMVAFITSMALQILTKYAIKLWKYVFSSAICVAIYTLKPVLSDHSKIDRTNIWMANGSLMKVVSIAECSHWTILQNFWPALSDYWSWKPFLAFFKAVTLDRFYCIKSLPQLLGLVLRSRWHLISAHFLDLSKHHSHKANPQKLYQLFVCSIVLQASNALGSHPLSW